MCCITQGHPRADRIFGHRPLTFYGVLFHTLNLIFSVPHRGPTTPRASSGFGLFRFRSPLLTESLRFLFLRLLRCFTSPGIALSPLYIQGEATRYDPGKVTPFGNLRVVKRICRSPKLIAAYHVLHRLLAPRHPPCALTSLFLI